MEYINIAFLEAYKRLDKLCQETYRSRIGVTNYIDDMKRVSPFVSTRISHWDDDLRQLIALRHIRNQITHDVDTLRIAMCTQSDIDWLEDFHDRILHTSDPLALLAKYYKGKEQQAKATPRQPYTSDRSAPAQSKPPLGCLIALIAAPCIGGIILLAVLIFHLL